jgi:UDP-N-acetylmuramoyl-tripeptide--D-alanyl-D-alanine ligase
VFTINDLIFALTGYMIPQMNQSISATVIDSRNAIEASLFIAMPGEHFDGHDFVGAAFDNGAIAAIIDQSMPGVLNILDLREGHFDPTKIQVQLPICLRVENSLKALQVFAAYWRVKHPVTTIGITGSVGKTTTKELIAMVLSQKFNVLKNPGNRNNEIGLPLTLLELEPQHEVAVLEMGFYVLGEIAFLCEIAQPSIGVITNVGTVHSERAGSQTIIAQGKAELVQALPPKPDGLAILNMDDPWVRKMAAKTKAEVLSYGIHEDADLKATDIKILGLDGLTCTINYQGKSYPISSPLLGEFSVYTILRATAVALSLGMTWDQIQSGVSAKQIQLRMRSEKIADDMILIDDTYNASPASTIAALQFLKGLPGRRVAILGDMLELGQYEQTGHQSVGDFLPEAVDFVILVGQRSQIIAQAAQAKGFSEQNLLWFPNSDQAAEPAVNVIGPGDVILVKGSNSMRMHTILDAIKARYMWQTPQ